MEHLRENGANGMSDMAGKAARVEVEPSGSERDTTGEWLSDIEGKVAMVAASERGRRASFKAFGGVSFFMPPHCFIGLVAS